MAQGDKIGVCPLCGGDVLENSKAFGCSNWKEADGNCKFTIWKNIAKKDIPLEEAKKLVEGKETDLIDGFTSKAGKPFSAKLALQDGKVTFVFPPRN